MSVIVWAEIHGPIREILDRLGLTFSTQLRVQNLWGLDWVKKFQKSQTGAGPIRTGPPGTFTRCAQGSRVRSLTVVVCPTLFNPYWQIPGHELDRYLKKTGSHEKMMDEFSRNRSNSCPRNWNFEKYWVIFPEIRLCHTPENWNFGKFSGWVFQDLPIRVKRVCYEYCPFMYLQWSLCFSSFLVCSITWPP